MEENGFVKFYRSMLDWEWFKDDNTFRLFFYLILKANWKDGRFMGYEIPRGSIATSQPQLADATGLSIQNVRTSLKHLKDSGEISIKLTPKFSLITVINYANYQDSNSNLTVNQQSTNRQLTYDQQSTNRQLTTIEERKNIRKKEGKNNKQIVFPENLNTDSFRSHWERWVKYRKERRNPLVESTIESQLVFLSKYSEEVAIWIIEKSINKGWQGLFEPKSDELAAMAAKKEKGKGDGIFDILNNFNPEKDDIWQ